MCLLTNAVSLVSSAAGDLDPSFGANGKVTTNFNGSGDRANAVAIQSDGKIVVAGFADTGNFDFAMVRYNNDGTLDASFGSNGKVTTDVNSGSFDSASALAIQSDGKIILAGSTSPFNQGSDFALARYTSTGALDATFGPGGKVITSFNGLSDGANAIAIQSDGKIVLAGSANSGNDFALVHLNRNTRLFIWQQRQGDDEWRRRFCRCDPIRWQNYCCWYRQQRHRR